MDLLIPTKFEQVCRTCMTDKAPFQNLFDFVVVDDTTNEKIQIFELLNTVIHQLPKIEITNDELPKNICTCCVEKACVLLEFQKCCISSDLQLRKLISRSFYVINETARQTDPLNEDIFALEKEIKQENTLTDVQQDTFDEVCVARIKDNSSNVNLLTKQIDDNDEIFSDTNDHDNVANVCRINERNWHCEMCGKIYSYRKSLGRHMQSVHKNRDADNLVENFNTRKPINEEYGKNEIGNDGQPKCIAEKMINIENRFPLNKTDDHKSLATLNIEGSTDKIWLTTETWSCQKCQQHFLDKQNYEEHLLSNHREKLENNAKEAEEKHNTFKCKICDVVFKRKLALQKHLKLKHEQAVNSKIIKLCELCEQGFRTAKKLLEHYTSAHPERLKSDEQPVPEALKNIFCPYCKKGMKHINDHLRSHTKERPYLCCHCGKGLSSSTSLSQHMLRHTGEKRYACQECPKRFTCHSDLCSHRHIHKKDKPHICDICGNAFKKTHELTVHKRIHDGRKYKCEYCGKDFVCGKHLRRHLLTHTGEKPYKCKYCSRSFSQSNDMIKHLRTHLGKNVYQCELCPAAFPMAGERRAHFSTHNNDDEATRERNKRALHEAQEKLRLKFQLNNQPGEDNSI